MQIRKSAAIAFISLLSPFLSFEASAGDCVVVILGGAKEWVTLLPGIGTDISIDVDKAVRMETLRTGCRMIPLANDNEKDFYEGLSRLKKPPYNKPGTKYHIAFTDHGAPPSGKINDSLIITGKGEYTKNSRFMNELKTIIPKGSQVTYQTNTCWGGSFADAVFANNMDEHFSMCGGSSTAPHVMSWNLHSLTRTDEGKLIGPYGALGLHYANEVKRTTSHFPGISDFHHQAKKGDVGNLSRQPGLTSSVAFAHYKLLQAKMKSPIDTTDVTDTLMNFNWKPGTAVEDYLRQPVFQQSQVAQTALVGACTSNVKNPFTDFLKKFGPIYQTLVNQEFDSLPDPVGQRTKAARDYLIRNQRKFATLLATVARERAQFVKDNALHPREKYTEVEEKWNKLKRQQNAKMSDFLFHFRNLQEGKTVQAFLARASAPEKKRFLNLLECEKKPIF